MHKIGFILFACLSFFVLAMQSADHLEERSVSIVLELLGDDPVLHKPDFKLKNVDARIGEAIVKRGRSKKGDGKKTRRQSPYFTCIACHNTEKEDPDLANPNPIDRLSYVKEQDLPFLQGSPLYGVVNRTEFYNGDYVKKYGDLVAPTRKDLREAIQLCAVECSQGRALKDWELESVLAYLWTIDLKMGDLLLSTDESELIEKALENHTNRPDVIRLIKSKYLSYAPATFIEPPKDRTTGDHLVGNAVQGKTIYEISCQYCHFENEYSFLKLDDTQATFAYLLRQAKTYHPHSMYQVIRYGTPPKSGKRAYMPQYTAEKMTDQQMADLRAYIELKANEKK